jgi:hypothetical protein
MARAAGIVNFQPLAVDLFEFLDAGDRHAEARAGISR